LVLRVAKSVGGEMGEPAVPPPDLRSKMLEYLSEKSMSTPLNHLII